jgi:protein regulator of cytokinesis 1
MLRSNTETEMQHIFTRNGAGLVEQLMAKTQFWEQERNKIFYYDELPLLAMLKDYMLTLKEKEEEKYRQRVSSQMVDGTGIT